jgi:hypothetical protein
MAKTTVKKKAARRKRDLTLEDAQRAKRRLRALIQAQRDMSRLASQLLRATDESRARLLVLANAIAAERGFELRAQSPIASTLAQADRQEADIPLAFGDDDVAAERGIRA